MQQLQILIVDDEPLAREVLQTYIGRIDTLQLAGVCKNALEAFAFLNKQPVDLVLLDINMPEMSGIDLLKSLKNPPLVIFTTAYTEFAVESYELNALDYLLKPISFPRFLTAIQKAQESLFKAQQPAPVEAKPPGDQLLFVRSEGRWVKIDLAKLWIVEGLKDYVRLWIGEERIAVHSTMKNFEQQLEAYPQFVRIHKSHIVNLHFVNEVDGNNITVLNQQLAIGGTYKDEVHSRLDRHKLL
jgi:DNA-binding LytR/AlgR family response regulator